jgi:hypothetical protein
MLPMPTIRRTARGRATAIENAIAPPIELPTTSQRSIPRASISPNACWVQVSRP